MPIGIVSLELDEPIRPLEGVSRYEKVRVLVRCSGRPIGWAWIDNRHRRPAVGPGRIRDEVDAQLDFELVRRALAREFVSDTSAASHPSCSVVICTRDRTTLLAECLEAVFDLDYPDFEVVVVDNAPSDEATRKLVSSTTARYVKEARPGLDWARNRGLSASRGEIVAFVDDDALPDRGWLRAIARAFADPEVMAVSGSVAPRELETWAQILFELELGGMMHGFRRRTIRGGTPSDLLWASSFVVGTNMAYRKTLFENEAPFDPALDVGTASGGGGDVEMAHRLVAHGYTMVYEPAALVWHLHRRTLRGLARQLYQNQTGFGSYLLTCARNRTVGRWEIARFALREWLWGWIIKRLIRPGDLPRRFVWAELRGALISPLAYLRSRRDARRHPKAALVPAITAVLVLLSACVGSEPPEPDRPIHPSWTHGEEHVTYDFGAGSLETTGNEPWDGSSYIVFPPVFSTDAYPVEFEVHGLDLSGIEYGGDLGWPPDGTDTGALFQATLAGSGQAALRVYSDLSGFPAPLDHRDGHRAYRFAGFDGSPGPRSSLQLDLEPDSADGTGSRYDTFDMRVRYEDGLVRSWVRMHASRAWDQGERESGLRCPSNVAINNAVPGTEDEVWTGECAAAEPGRTGLAVGAWVALDAWSAVDPGAARVSLYLGNWAFADGPYRVTWDGVTVRGVPSPAVTSSSIRARFRAFGTGQSEREPRGEWAYLSMVASEGGELGPSATLRYHAPSFEVAVDEAESIEITSDGTVLAGPARVNGVAGYRFEFRGGPVEGSESDRVSLRVWGPVPSLWPHFEAFGSLDDGSIEVRPAQPD